MAIWDEYQQRIGQGGWTPPAGIEGQRGLAWSTSGNQEWRDAQSGGNMARKQTYFPGVNSGYSQLGSGNAGFGPSQGLLSPDQNPAYQAAIANGSTYKSRRDDFRNKYPQLANPVAQQNLQNFDVNQAYQQGYGPPSPTIQQGPGGQYIVSGGVAAPYDPPNIFQRFALGVSGGLMGLGTFANNVKSYFPAVPGLNAATQYGQNVSTGRGVGNQPQNQALQTVQNFQQTGSFYPQANTQPRRYFDY